MEIPYRSVLWVVPPCRKSPGTIATAFREVVLQLICGFPRNGGSPIHTLKYLVAPVNYAELGTIVKKIAAS